MHPREEERIKELSSYFILDTEAEKNFDYLTELASAICGKPIALVSLIDSDRQWFKSKRGLDVSETHRDFAFCSHAILEDGLFEVKDTEEDERFFDNPLVKGEPYIRFYAGEPLVSSRGIPMGTLCVLDDKPGELNQVQRSSLKALASQVVELMELRLKNIQLIDSLENLRKANVEVRLRQEQLMSLAKKHFLNDLASGVIDQLRLPLEELNEEVFQVKNKGHDVTKLEYAVVSIRKTFLYLERIASWEEKKGKEHFDLASILNTLMIISKSLREKKNIQMHNLVHRGTMIKGNRYQVSQVFLHLLKNSVKALENCEYNARSITIRPQMKGDCLEIIFEDSGNGISDQLKPMLFKAFIATENDQPGLGLYLSRTYMLENGGDLELMNDDTTKFLLRFPAAA